MARAYDIAVAALAIGVERKWLDNLTSQHSIPGTEHLARGVARRLAMRTLITAAIVRDLSRGLGVPVARSVEIAARLLAAEESHDPRATPPAGAAQCGEALPSIEISDSISLAIDIAAIERTIERGLLSAMETVVPRRRGRPPLKERRGTR